LTPKGKAVQKYKITAGGRRNKEKEKQVSSAKKNLAYPCSTEQENLPVRQPTMVGLRSIPSLFNCSNRSRPSCASPFLQVNC
jgi:hypothetical protein